MDLLHLLEQQPYMELNKELRIYSTNDGKCIDYRIAEFAFPTEFGDWDGTMYWQEWMNNGMMMQVRIEPTTTMKLAKAGENKED
jgi:hypothetical protein